MIFDVIIHYRQHLNYLILSSTLSRLSWCVSPSPTGSSSGKDKNTKTNITFLYQEGSGASVPILSVPGVIHTLLHVLRINTCLERHCDIPIYHIQVQGVPWWKWKFKKCLFWEILHSNRNNFLLSRLALQCLRYQITLSSSTTIAPHFLIIWLGRHFGFFSLPDNILLDSILLLVFKLELADAAFFRQLNIFLK